MRTIEEIIYGLDCDKHDCVGCAYESGRNKNGGCMQMIYNDCKEAVPYLLGEYARVENKLREKESYSGNESVGYWNNICKLNAKQEAKGKSKYGVPLEDNTTLTRKQRIEHLEEELIDGLKYCEHLKAIDDDGITANDYQRAAMRTAGPNPEEYLLNGVMGLCGEAGEVIDLVKKYLHQGHDLDEHKIAEEVSDCLWYCALIASALDMKLGDIMRMNIDKLKARYPEGFSKERSIHREENNA